MTKEIWDEIIKNGAYIQELDWFATDINGNIGVFSAVMNAQIPESVKASYDNYIRLNRWIESLPLFTSAILTTSEAGDFSSWILYAEKGLFAFDFQDIHRLKPKKQYDLIARPVNPLNINNLVISVDTLAAFAKLDCDFASVNISTELSL